MSARLADRSSVSLVSLLAMAASLVACAPLRAGYDLAAVCEPGGIAEIVDNFGDDAATVGSWDAYPDGNSFNTASRNRGQLIVTTSGQAGAFSNYNWTGGPRSLLECSASVEMTSVDSTAGGVTTYFVIRRDNAAPLKDEISIGQEGGSLVMSLLEGSESQPVVDARGKPAGSRPFDEVKQRFWRIREAEQTIYFDTSPDGLEWTNQAQAATPSYAGSVNISLGIGSSDDTDPTIATFDNLNLVP